MIRYSAAFKCVGFLAILFGVCSVQTLAQDAPPDPVVNDGGVQHPDDRTYTGDTCEELSDNMPSGEVGACEYEISYSYDLKLVSCEEKSGEGEEEGFKVVIRPMPVTVTLDIHIEMPTWDGYDDAAPACQAAWDAFYASLLEHENGHKRIANAMAKRLANNLWALRGCGCGKTKKEALEAAKKDLKTKAEKEKNDTDAVDAALQALFHLLFGDGADLICP